MTNPIVEAVAHAWANMDGEPYPGVRNGADYKTDAEDLLKRSGLSARITELELALEEAAQELEDYSPLTGNTIQTTASRRIRAVLEKKIKS